MRIARTSTLAILTGTLLIAQSAVALDVTFHFATDQPKGDSVEIQLPKGLSLFAQKDAVLTNADLMYWKTASAKFGDGVQFILTPEAMTTFVQKVSEFGMSRLAIRFDGTYYSNALVQVDSNSNTMDLAALKKGQAADLVRALDDALNTNPNAVVLTLRSSQKKIKAGGTVDVEIFISNAKDIRGYQFDLEISGEHSGKLERISGKVDTHHPAYIFKDTADAHFAYNPTTGQLLNILQTGGVACENAYAATFTYKVSDDATGTFFLQFRRSPKTVTLNSGGKLVLSRPGNTLRLEVE